MLGPTPVLPSDVAVSLALLTDVTHGVTRHSSSIWGFTLIIMSDLRLVLCEQVEAWRCPWLFVVREAIQEDKKDPEYFSIPFERKGGRLS